MGAHHACLPVPAPGHRLHQAPLPPAAPQPLGPGPPQQPLREGGPAVLRGQDRHDNPRAQEVLPQGHANKALPVSPSFLIIMIINT